MADIPRWQVQCKRFIRLGKKMGDADTAMRFRIVAKLARGESVTAVARALGCAVSTASMAKARFLSGSVEGLLDRRAHNGKSKVTASYLETLRSVLRKTPQDFGWQRNTWTRELLALELHRRNQPLVAPCTMGRALAAIRARRSAPKPFVDCPWPARKRQRRLRELKRLAANATRREPVVYVDEVDIHLNPKIGRDWTLPGERRFVRTPGKNEKHSLAGALNAATRELTWVDGRSKTSALFCQLVWRMVSDNAKAKRIHLILDNYIIHKSKKTQRFLAQFGERAVLHFLPPFCPDANDIERVWLDLHASVTRNHRRRTMRALLRDVLSYLDARKVARRHVVAPRLQPSKKAARPRSRITIGRLAPNQAARDGRRVA